MLSFGTTLFVKVGSKHPICEQQKQYYNNTGSRVGWWELELGFSSSFHHWQLTTEVLTSTGEYAGLFCTEKRQHFG